MSRTGTHRRPQGRMPARALVRRRALLSRHHPSDDGRSHTRRTAPGAATKIHVGVALPLHQLREPFISTLYVAQRTRSSQITPGSLLPACPGDDGFTPAPPSSPAPVTVACTKLTTKVRPPFGSGEAQLAHVELAECG